MTEYLSTDPNAGDEYLSVDPNAGDPGKKPRKAPAVEVARNAIYGGAAGLPDALLNTPNRIANLVKAGVGTAMGAAGVDPQKLPQMTPDVAYIENLMRKAGIITDAQPQGTGQKALDVLLRGATAGALTGGGGLTGTLAGASLGATSSGASAATEALTGNPTAGIVAGTLAPAAAARVPSMAQSAGQFLMRSALKPGVRAGLRGQGDQAVETMLTTRAPRSWRMPGENVSAGGAERLNTRIGEINQTVADLIAKSTGRVDVGAAAAPVRGTYRRFANQVDPNGDLAAIDAVLRGWQGNPVVGGAQTIPVQLANDIKTGTYRTLRGQYGERGSAAVEANKAIARGLRDEISNAVPEVTRPLLQEGALINARDLVNRRMVTEGQKNPAGGISVLAHSAPTYIGALASSSALAKSLLARAFYNGPGRLGIPRLNAEASSLIPLSDRESQQ